MLRNSCWLWDDGNHGSEGVEFNIVWDEIDVLQQGLDSNCGYHVILNFYAALVGYDVALPEDQSGYKLNSADSREFARDAKQMINCAIAGFIDTETILSFLNRWNIGRSRIQKGHDIYIQSTPVMRLKEPDRKRHANKSFQNRGLDMIIDQVNREMLTLKQMIAARSGKSAQQVEEETAPYLTDSLQTMQEMLDEDSNNEVDEDMEGTIGTPKKGIQGRPKKGKGGRGARYTKTPSSSIHINQDNLMTPAPVTTPSGVQTETSAQQTTPVPAGAPPTQQSPPSKKTSPKNQSYNRPGGATNLHALPRILTEAEVADLIVWDRLIYSAKLKWSQDLGAREAEKAAQDLQQEMAAQPQDTDQPWTTTPPASQTAPPSAEGEEETDQSVEMADA
jgi:hypothetical protein